MEKLLTVKETADILNVRVMQVYSWMSEGIIPSCRIGRSIRVSPEALRSFIANGGKSYDGPGGWRKEE